MRAGLLSDPRVVHLLRSHFVPCMVSARNTKELMADARDLALLETIARTTGEPFQGGERELFVLPDGTPQRVFMSLHGDGGPNVCPHRTAAGRRSEDAVRPFRRNAERALKAVREELPEAWTEIWDGDRPEVTAITAEPARWPVPLPGEQALRVHVRNSHLQYDDLHGCELTALPSAAADAMAKALRQAGDTSVLPREVFAALARAMAPRGQVGTCVADESIRGDLVLVAERVEGDVVTGRVEGTFALAPTGGREVSLRANAVCMFTSQGRLGGTFRVENGRLAALRAVGIDVELVWRPPFAMPEATAPHHAVAIEFVATPAAR